MGLTVVITMCISGALTYFGISLFRKYSLNKEWLDVPNQRSSHENPTPRGAGLIVVPVCLAGYVLTTRLTGIHVGWGYLFGALTVALISWLDDLYSISFAWRFLAHILAAYLLVYPDGYWSAISIGNGISLSLGWIGFPVTMIWIVWVINAYNFMDGIDGIAGLQGLVASAAWAAIAAKDGNGIYFFSLIIFSSLVGFILHNWHPARVFIGDVGSAFLGLTFTAIPLLLSREMPDQSELLPLASILILWPFVFDTILTVVRRAFRRELIWQAHREHLYQRLVIAGLSHSQVTVIYGLFAVITSSAALLLFSQSTNLTLASIGLIIAVSVLLALVVSKVYRNVTGLSNAANEAK